MENINKLVEAVIKINTSEDMKIYYTKSVVSEFTLDFCSLIKNIKETSVSFEDKKIRCQKLASDSGLNLKKIEDLVF